MDYLKIYNSICDRAKDRNLIGYSEAHHILPKSLGGGDGLSNIVKLTGREHFVVHKILAKTHKGPMIYAFLMMCNTNINGHGFERFKVSSRDYELARKLLSDKLTGVKRSEATKLKVSQSQLERMKDPKIRAMCATRTGTHNTEAQKKQISEKLKGIPKAKAPPCPHCGKICNKATAVRWHYYNCKMRT